MSTVNPYETPQASLEYRASDVYDQTSPFSAAGRFGRAGYIAYAFGSYLVVVLVLAIVGAASSFLGNAGAMVLGGASVIAYVMFFAFSIIFMIRRLHDLNWSGWLSVLTIIPLANLIIAIPCLFFRGTNGANNYGPPPKSNTTYTVVASIFVVLVTVAMIGVLAAIAIPAYQQYTQKAQEMSQQVP
jgi:uncharacterized membrane protein YhaH (DUF805 family)